MSGTEEVVAGHPNCINFSHMVPGATTTKTLTLGVTTNGDWQIQVSKDKDLTISGTTTYIPSANFTFTSSAGTPAPPGTPTYVSDTQFGTDTNVVTNGEAADGCQVNVVYKLEIPAAQPPGRYFAYHTYTLIVP